LNIKTITREGKPLSGRQHEKEKYNNLFTLPSEPKIYAIGRRDWPPHGSSKHKKGRLEEDLSLTRKKKKTAGVYLRVQDRGEIFHGRREQQGITENMMEEGKFQVRIPRGRQSGFGIMGAHHGTSGGERGGNNQRRSRNVRSINEGKYLKKSCEKSTGVSA